jgi:4-hydroxythreonine-4-phosphate dehydrogenase
MKPIIGISIGDINGIGPEILLEAFDDNRLLEMFTPIIFGSSKVLAHYKKNLPDNKLQLNGIKDFTAVNAKQVNVYNCWEEDVEVKPGIDTKEAGKCAVRALQAATQALKDGHIHGLVTMPINKSNTQLPDFNYAGHTPFLKDKFGAKDVLMLMVTADLKVALLTEHVPVAEIAKHVTKENITSKLTMLQQSLIKDFGISKPKIAVLALNPHAGDGGLIGKEEKETIKPTIDELYTKGMKVFGPYAADGFFARQQDAHFDAVLAMYHDQGLIPFKSFDKAKGVNFTAGLQVVRTSPDHGTAYDIAGKGIAEIGSFLEAVYTCIDVLENRTEHKIYTANPLKRTSGNSTNKRYKSKHEEMH